MREITLKEFFAGNLNAVALSTDLEGSLVTSGIVTKHPIEDMDETFVVWPEHLTRSCEAVLSGYITPRALQAIGFCVVASDNFEYDTDTPEGDLVGETLMDWSAPD